MKGADTLPFRWDLVAPDQLGTLLAGTESPRLWFVDDLSFARPGVPSGRRRHPARPRPPGAAGTFVDMVHEGGTFTDLFTLLRDWIDEERESWRVIRRKVRFVGVTIRRETSPDTYRWQHDAAWTRQLPARSVVNVSLGWPVWTYLGDRQAKLTRTFKPEGWLAEVPGPGRDLRTRQAIAEALAVVHYGRSTAGRRAVARATAGEPALAEAWLRTLVTALTGT